MSQNGPHILLGEKHKELLKIVSAIFSLSLDHFHAILSEKMRKYRGIAQLLFSRANSHFQEQFYKIPGQMALFSNSRSFLGPKSNSKTFQGLCEPTSVMLLTGLQFISDR